MQVTLQSKPARVESDVATVVRGPVLLDPKMLRHVVGGVASGAAATAAVVKAASTDAPRGRWA